MLEHSEDGLTSSSSDGKEDSLLQNVRTCLIIAHGNTGPWQRVVEAGQVRCRWLWWLSDSRLPVCRTRSSSTSRYVSTCLPGPHASLASSGGVWVVIPIFTMAFTLSAQNQRNHVKVQFQTSSPRQWFIINDQQMSAHWSDWPSWDYLLWHQQQHCYLVELWIFARESSASDNSWIKPIFGN